MPSLSSELSPGTRVGEFLIQGTTRIGEQTIVYRAQNESNGLIYALTEFFPRAIANRDEGDGSTVLVADENSIRDFNSGLDSFLRKAEILTALRNSACPTIEAVEEMNFTAYAANLEVDSADFTPGDDGLRGIVEKICEVLDIAHRLDVVHGNIHPGSMGYLSGAFVLTDWLESGIQGERLWRDKNAPESCFLAPEQLASDRQSPGPHSDIYALSATLYAMLTGRIPLSAGIRIATTADGLTDPLIPVSSFDLPDTTRGIGIAVQSGMNLSPPNRPKTIRAWLDVSQATKPDKHPRSAAPQATDSRHEPDRQKETLSSVPRNVLNNIWVKLVGTALIGMLVVAAGLQYFFTPDGGTETDTATVVKESDPVSVIDEAPEQPPAKLEFETEFSVDDLLIIAVNAIESRDLSTAAQVIEEAKESGAPEARIRELEIRLLEKQIELKSSIETE